MAHKKKKQQVQTDVKKMERTGTHTFNVKHDDGSIFECEVDDPNKFDYMPGVDGSGKKYVSISGFNTQKKPLICDSCRKRVYKIRIANGQSICNSCSK